MESFGDDELLALVHRLDKLYHDRDQGLYRDLEGQLEFTKQRQHIYKRLHDMHVSLKQARDIVEGASRAMNPLFNRGVTMAHIVHCVECLQQQYFGYGGVGPTKRGIDLNLIHETNKILRQLWDLRRREMCQRRKG